MSSQAALSDPFPPVGPRLAGTAAVWRGTRNDLLIATGHRNMRFTATVGLISNGLLAGIFVHAGYPTWRVIAQLTVFALMVSAQFFTVRRVRRTATCIDQAVVGLHSMAQVYLVGVVALTGGLHSPLIASIGSATALPIIFFGAQAVSRRLTASLVVLFVAMAMLPGAWLGPALPPDHYIAAAIISFVWTVLIVTTFVTRIHHATVAASCTVDRLSEEQVAASAEQLLRLQSVGSKVAHELKNPLASIKGLVQLVARSTESAKNQERLEVVRSEIVRMETILAEYLSFSRPLDELRPQPVDVAALVADVITVIAGRAEQATIAVAVDTRPAKIAADPRRLKEALLNLLANAIEATPAGGRIAVIARPADGADGGAMIEVRDTGRGIKPDDLARLGTSFFTTRDGGTGLGVVLAHNVVAQHGGTMHYASAPGRGTSVTIRLPPAPTPAAQGLALTTSPARSLEPAA